MRKFFVSLFILINPVSSFAQLQGANWVFGDSICLSFTGVAPSYFLTNIYTSECSSSISDSNGNLLFYVGSEYNLTGGVNNFFSVWNASNQKVGNGDSLEGSYSVTQGSLILQSISNSNIYYILHLDLKSGGFPTESFYSTYDNSLGSITNKNVNLGDSITEKMSSVKHGNGTEWWILNHEYGNSTFVKYLLSNNGVSSPNYQSLGAPIDLLTFDAGQMVFNTVGNKIAMANIAGQLELFDFDRCTGNLTFNSSLGDMPYNRFNGFYGCSFSENDNYLYASTTDSLFQFDLNAANIKSSKKLIYTAPDIFIGQHLLKYGEGKIYIAIVNTVIDSLNKYFSVINLPEQPDTLCDFQPYSFSLNGRRHGGGLPNMPNYNLGRLVGSPCDTLTDIKNIEQETISIYPIPATEKVKVSHTQKILTCKLENTEGESILEQRVGANNFEVDVSTLPTGVYFLKMVTKTNSFVRKIVKQ